MKKDKKLNRFIKAINVFGTRHYEVDKQILRDLSFMEKIYKKSGGFNVGKVAAQKALFKRIFKKI